MVGGRRGTWQLLKLLPGLVVAGVCLWYAVRDVDWSQVRDRWAGARWSLAPVMAVLLFSFFALKALRWKLLLDPVSRMPVRAVAGPLMIGFMANNLLPAHLGELVRVHVLGRTRGVPRAAVLSTVVLERLFDLVAILVFLGAGLVADPRLRDDYHRAVAVVAVLTGVMLAGAVTFVCASDRCLKIVDWISNRCLVFLPSRWRKGLVELVASAAGGLGALKRPRLAVGIVATSLVKWFLMGLMVWVSLRTLGADDVFGPSLVVVGVIAVAILLPAPPGYVGVVQFCFTSVLAIYAVDANTAIAASVYYHLWQFIPVTLVGLWCLQKTGLGWREVTEVKAGSDRGNGAAD